VGEEFPLEIFWNYPFPFSLHLDNDGENLFSLNWTFDDSLGVTDKIIFFIFNIINTVHDIFTVASLIEHHISFPKFTGGAFQADVVSCVDQEWSHAAARDDHAHLLSFLNEGTQHGYVFFRIDSLHNGAYFTLSDNFQFGQIPVQGEGCFRIHVARIGADACLSGQNLQIVECFAGELWIPPVDCNLRAESFEMLHGCLGTDGVIRCLFDEYNGLQRAAFIVTDTAGTAYRPSRYLVVAVWKWTEQGTVAIEYLGAGNMPAPQVGMRRFANAARTTE